MSGTSANFRFLFRAGLIMGFREEFEDFAPEHQIFLKKGSVDKPEVEMTMMSGPNRFYEIDDGEEPSFERPKLGPKIAATDKEFALGISVTERAVEDDQYGKLKDSGKYLARASRMTREYTAASLLDDAFAGGTFRTYDGLSLVNASHTFIGENASGRVFNNNIGTVGFSTAAVNAGMEIYMTMKDHNNDPIKMWPDLLLLGNNSADANEAVRIFKSDQEPGTADNQDNPYKARLGSLKIEVSRFKSSSRSFFFINTKYNDVHMLDRRTLKLTDFRDDKTGAYMFIGKERYMIFARDWRGWAGSNPA